LSDKDRRSLYDQMGTIDVDDSLLGDDFDWRCYWQKVFPKVTVDEIMNFEDSYKGSEEEQATIRQLYLDSEGDMDVILEGVRSR